MIRKNLWWLLPAMLAVVLVAALLVAESTAAAPFLYTVF